MQPTQSKPRVLVVEDEVAHAQILRMELESRGYSVEIASDGQDGLKKAREMKPDIVLLDLMLPKLDGYKVCRLLKFDERYRHIPIIVISAKSQKGDETQAMEMGANRFISKPYEFADIVTEMESLLKATPTRT